MATRVLSGARLAFWFDNKPVAYAAGVTWSEEIQYEAVDVLDNLAVVEHVPVGYRVTLSAEIYKTVANGPSTQTNPGSLKEQGIMPTFDEILFKDGAVATLHDRVTNKVVAQFANVKTQRNNQNGAARGVIRSNVEFVTTRMFDEKELAAASAL